MIADNPRLYGQNNGFVILKMDSLGYPFFNNRKIEHMVTVKDIYEGTNISDSWCKSKIARFNNILAMTCTHKKLYKGLPLLLVKPLLQQLIL